MSIVSIRSAASGRDWSLIWKILAALKAYRIRRERYLAVRALAELNDYLLKDMGISRPEIHALVYGLSPDTKRRADEDIVA